MQDRFRFRVWNKRKCDMEYDAEARADFYELLYSDNRVIMQCTGLRDKNGTLIYEGDVVKVLTCYISSSPKDSIWENSVVRWADGGWLGILIIKGLYKPERHEVIGNIWEHKHLIEEGK